MRRSVNDFSLSGSLFYLASRRNIPLQDIVSKLKESTMERFALWPYVVIALVAMIVYRFVWMGGETGRTEITVVGSAVAVVALAVDLLLRFPEFGGGVVKMESSQDEPEKD